MFKVLLNLLINLKTFVSLLYKFKDRVNKCCSNKKINPVPNSTAEKIKIKNVNDSKFKLS